MQSIRRFDRSANDDGAAKLEVVPFRAEHLMRLQQDPPREHPVTPEEAVALEAEFAFTGLVDGEPMACAGLVHIWPGRGLLWALLSVHSGPHMLQIHRAARRLLGVCDVRRIECTVDEGFEPGHRWARMLGFRLEAPRMANYRPCGGDSALYARVH